MKRRTIILTEDEYNALRLLAEQERRDLRDQASVLIRRGLEEQGWLPPLSDQHEAKQEAEQ